MNSTSLEAVVSIELNATPERVFQALTTGEITKWWVRPGIFDTRSFSGDARTGGTWKASGTARGNAYELEGSYLEVDGPKKLVHTWHLVGSPLTTTVSYELVPTPAGTRLTLTHGTFPSEEIYDANRIGWDTSFEALRDLLGA